MPTPSQRSDLEQGQERRGGTLLIDWPNVAAKKFLLLRNVFDDFWSCLATQPNSDLANPFQSFRHAGGDAMENHARFEAIYAGRRHAGPLDVNWRVWPMALRDPQSPRSRISHPRIHEMSRSMSSCNGSPMSRLHPRRRLQKNAGMRIGLIADLAVSMESGGSQAWSRRPPNEGAYLTYPSLDLLRLLKLESVRHQADIIGDNLENGPRGIQDSLADAAIAGMDVLWFARDKETFLPPKTSPKTWRRDAVAMTSTHDLPTIAWWWRGLDIALYADRDLLGQDDDVTALNQARNRERSDLWKAFETADIIAPMVSISTEPRPAVDAAIALDVDRIVDAPQVQARVFRLVRGHRK
ncbi:MAG: 4-alpha-glucanotransferase [Methylovirgula sp.]